jgi:hypothetical protein
MERGLKELELHETEIGIVICLAHLHSISRWKLYMVQRDVASYHRLTQQPKVG